MTVTHKVGDDLLMGYAAGLLPRAQDLLVATAVSLDDDARARLAGFEAMGGALLSEGEIAPLRDDSYEEVMDRITSSAPEDTVEDRVKTPRVNPVLPQPLREVVGGDVDSVQWRAAGLGVRQAILAVGEQGTVRLLSIPAGQAMPDHGHGGEEYTLVLQGAVIDGDARYGRGDLEVADDAVNHQPVADTEEDCICLVVTNAPLKFRGLLPRVAQRFLDI